MCVQLSLQVTHHLSVQCYNHHVYHLNIFGKTSHCIRLSILPIILLEVQLNSATTMGEINYLTDDSWFELFPRQRCSCSPLLTSGDAMIFFVINNSKDNILDCWINKNKQSACVALACLK